MGHQQSIIFHSKLLHCSREERGWLRQPEFPPSFSSGTGDDVDLSLVGINKRLFKTSLVVSLQDAPSGVCGISDISPQRAQAPSEPSLCLFDKKRKMTHFQEIRTVWIMCHWYLSLNILCLRLRTGCWLFLMLGSSKNQTENDAAEAQAKLTYTTPKLCTSSASCF